MKASLAEATSVRVYRHVDVVDHAKTEPLFVVEDPSERDALSLCLVIEESSLEDEVALMMPGDLRLDFMKQRSVIQSVVVILPQFIRCAALPSDARLLHPELLQRWLADHGFDDGC